MLPGLRWVFTEVRAYALITGSPRKTFTALSWCLAERVPRWTGLTFPQTADRLARVFRIGWASCFWSQRFSSFCSAPMPT